MAFLLFIGILFISVLVFVSLLATWKLRKFVFDAPFQSSDISESLVPVSVIIPCKGDDGRLYENLETLLNQDYPDAEFILVTASENDPARSALHRIRAAHQERRIKTVVAGISDYGSEKCNNLLKAVQAADPNSEIFIFLDSDGKSDRRLIRKLASGLQDSTVAGVSGYRWYEPRWNRLPEVIRAAWNAASFTLLADPQTRFLWGGAMAFRRKIYEEARIADLWAKSISDDAPLRERLQSLGLSVRFLPNCIVLSSEEDSWHSLFQWVCRQTLVIRICDKKVFIGAFLWHVVGNLCGFGLLVWGLARGLSGDGPAVAVVGFLWIAHFWLGGWLSINPLQQMLQVSGVEVKFHKVLFIIVGPLVSLLVAFSAFYCLFANRVIWAGITYEIDGPIAKRL